MGWNTTYNSNPSFVADWNSIDRGQGRQIDWTKVPDTYKAGTTYTITTGGAAAAAVALPVTALPVALPVGAVLRFGTGEYARLTAPAAVGATSLAVEALEAAIEAADTAPFVVSLSNHKVIPAGTVMAFLSGTKMVPRAVQPGSEGSWGLLMSTAEENSKSDSLSGHGVIVGGVIYENLLPETITSYKTELETNGMTWLWLTYSDSSEV